TVEVWGSSPHGPTIYFSPRKHLKYRLPAIRRAISVGDRGGRQRPGNHHEVLAGFHGASTTRPRRCWVCLLWPCLRARLSRIRRMDPDLQVATKESRVLVGWNG